MMKYQIEFRKPALKFLKQQTLKEQKRLLLEIYKLPHGSNIKKLEGYSNRYRLRVGNIRVIYDKIDDILLILVMEIGHRGDIYK